MFCEYRNLVDVYDRQDNRIIANQNFGHKNGAGNGNRTRIAGLGSRNSTIELYLHLHYLLYTFFENLSTTSY